MKGYAVAHSNNRFESGDIHTLTSNFEGLIEGLSPAWIYTGKKPGKEVEKFFDILGIKE